jgi:hypothetical protein
MAVVFAIIENRAPERPEKYIPTASVHGDLIWSLLSRCWALNPELRPTAAQVREEVRIHEYRLELSLNIHRWQ